MVVSAPAIKLPVPPALPSRCNHLSFRVRCSSGALTADESPASSSGEEGGAVVGSGVGRPSIISIVNVQKAIRGLPITDADYYGTLGVPMKASYDQIQAAYESKCKELKNKEGLREEDLKTEFELLKEAYTILSINEERRIYDWSLARSEQPDRYVWPFDVDYLEMSPEDPPAQEPEDEWPTKVLGFGFLTFVVVSFIASVYLAIAYSTI